jgi:hypothetical protein
MIKSGIIRSKEERLGDGETFRPGESGGRSCDEVEVYRHESFVEEVQI